MFERLLALKLLLQSGSCLPNRGQVVWLKLGGAGCCAADDLIEGPNDVDFCARASK